MADFGNTKTNPTPSTPPQKKSLANIYGIFMMTTLISALSIKRTIETHFTSPPLMGIQRTMPYDPK